MIKKLFTRSVLLALVLMIASCIVHRVDVVPVDVSAETPIEISSPVKAHLYDGSTVVFPEGINVYDGKVRGKGERFNVALEDNKFIDEIALDEVAAMESFQTPVNAAATTAATTVGTAGWIALGTLAAFALFGSCPTVYSADSGDAILEAELFSYSIAPSFQARDIDKLSLKHIEDGYFELDFLIDQDTGEVYLGELNPRVTGASSITNHAVFALADAPLFVFHILEWMNVDYNLNIDDINERWSHQENIDGWSQLIVKHTEDTIEYVTDAPKSGIWKMFDNGHIQFDRMDTHRRAVETENEAFFLHIAKEGDYLYEGADMGILVSRGRMMTDDFKLNARAKQWINAIRNKYTSQLVEDKREKPELIGSLTK